jgi:hypothetical protein
MVLDSLVVLGEIISPSKGALIRALVSEYMSLSFYQYDLFRMD